MALSKAPKQLRALVLLGIIFTALTFAESPRAFSRAGVKPRKWLTGASSPHFRRSSCLQSTRRPCVQTQAAVPLETFSYKGTLCTKKSFMVTSLAFLAGVSDMGCWAKYHCYGNMMTGNTINMITTAIRLQWLDSLFCLSLVINYVAGIAIFRVADLKLRPKPSARAVAPVVLFLFALSDLLTLRNPALRWSLMPIALGSGIINAVSSEKLETITCMISGHLQKLVILLTDCLTRGLSDAQRSGLASSLSILVAFTGGVAFGAACIGCGSLPSFSELGLFYAALLVYNDAQLSGSIPPLSSRLASASASASSKPCELDIYETECIIDYTQQGGVLDVTTQSPSSIVDSIEPLHQPKVA